MAKIRRPSCAQVPTVRVIAPGLLLSAEVETFTDYKLNEEELCLEKNTYPFSSLEDIVEGQYQKLDHSRFLSSFKTCERPKKGGHRSTACRQQGRY